MAAAAAVVVVNRSENDSSDGPFLARDAPGEIAEEEEIALEPAVKLPDRVAQHADLKQRYDVEQLGLPGPEAKREAAKRILSAHLLKVSSLKDEIASGEEGGRKSQELWDLVAKFSRKREGLYEDREGEGEAERAAEDDHLLTSLVLRLKQKKERKRNFWKLCYFLTFVALYMTVIYLQQSVGSTYEVVTAHRLLLPRDPYKFTSRSDIYDWLNGTILANVWQAPRCGNGVCERPLEIPGCVVQAETCLPSLARSNLPMQSGSAAPVLWDLLCPEGGSSAVACVRRLLPLEF